MSSRLLLATACALAWWGCGHAPPTPGPAPLPVAPAAAPLKAKRLGYPATRGDTSVVDDFHGTRVADPYRWLEDADAEETRQWVEAQNRLTFGYLEKLPSRERIKARLTQLWNYERYAPPVRHGSRYVYSRNDGLQNQSVIYVLEHLKAEPRVLLDPNTLTTDGTVAVTSTSFTLDGNLMAYALSTAGSDWNEWRVRDVRTGKDLPDLVKWVKWAGATWTPDGKGFFYGRYAEPKAGEALSGANYYQKLYYHRLGTPQDQDTLIYERPDQKEWSFSGQPTEDGRYLIITVYQGTERKNLVFYKDLTKPKSKVVELVSQFESLYSFIGSERSTMYFHTTLDAPRGRLISVDLRKPDRANWKTVIPQGEATILGVSLLNKQFISSTLQDAHALIQRYAMDGKPLGEIELPGVGTVEGFEGTQQTPDTFYSFETFASPAKIYRYDLKTGTSELYREPKLAYDPDAYETKQVFFQSKDGTRIPLFISYKKGTKLDGTAPTYLYGYGGFNVSLTPEFKVANLQWMEMGGIYAQAVLRGGGEYGRAWHDAGAKLNKQNVFDDFIGAAEYLVREKYTQPSKLAIGGGSNGGLLVGAVMTQKPELFGAAFPAVGVMDMLRFNKFTIGWGWSSDYGTPENAEEFKALYAYSPLHNLKAGKRYPATLVTTGDHDDRVVPAHSYKFTAAAQKAQAGDAPVLIRIETRAGHGRGKPTGKQIEEASDKWAFALDALHVSQGP